MLKKININDIILKLYDEDEKNRKGIDFVCKVEDSHLWKVLEGSDDEHNYYYRRKTKKIKEEYLQSFKDLSINFNYLSGEFKNNYITLTQYNNNATRYPSGKFINNDILFKPYSRNNKYKYITTDGDHRLTILKFKGIKECLCKII